MDTITKKHNSNKIEEILDSLKNLFKTVKTPIKFHSKGGRLYIDPNDIFTSKEGKEQLEQLKKSQLYKKIKEEEKPIEA